MSLTCSIMGVIPARYGSSRLPGKPLLEIAGTPMIIHVLESVTKSSYLQEVIVATDDTRIAETVEKYGGKAVMTDKECVSGTDRIVQVVKDLPVDVVLNVQGDEPMIRHEMIDSLLENFLKDKSKPETGTLAHRLDANESYLDPGTVKVVFDNKGYALYFSRAPIPYNSNIDMGFPHKNNDNDNEHLFKFMYKHIGVYVYRKDFLLHYTKLPVSKYESWERLEQLRILENGYRIKIVETPFDCYSVDTINDYEFVCKLFHSSDNLL